MCMYMYACLYMYVWVRTHTYIHIYTYLMGNKKHSHWKQGFLLPALFNIHLEVLAKEFREKKAIREIRVGKDVKLSLFTDDMLIRDIRIGKDVKLSPFLMLIYFGNYRELLIKLTQPQMNSVK